LIKLDELLRPNFELFCAELFFFRLISEAGMVESQTPISCSMLQNEHTLKDRTDDPAYKRKVLTEIERILPGKRSVEIAKEILGADSALFRRWSKIIQDGLKSHKSTLSWDLFYDKAYPEASLVCAALLHQRSKSPDQVLTEFQKLKSGKSSGFREGDWIHHLLLGTLLLVYLPFRQTPCPIYAGFEAFTRLSGTSVRHFLELCHLSIGNFSFKTDIAEYSVPVADQASAAVRASRNFRAEVSNCGDQGNRLLALVNFMGKLFRLSQGRYSQSEAERTHFSIVGDEISSEATDVLNEALKWSVVFEAPETKVKGNRYESSDYILNPIYAPFFGISYNKGRKLEIPTTEAETILVGRFEQFTQLLREYEKSWSVDEGVDQMTLDFEG
jgi:hypothetical protein